MAAVVEPKYLKEVSTSDGNALLEEAGKDKSDKSDAKKFRAGNVKHIFQFGTTSDFLLLGLGVVCFSASGLMLPLFMLYFGQLLDSAATLPPPTTPTVTASSKERGYEYYVVMQVILGAISFVMSWVGTTATEFSAERQLWRMRQSFLTSVMRQEMGWFDTFDSGTLASRLNENCLQIRDALGMKFGQLFFFLFMFIGGFTVGFVKGWQLSLVMVACLPLLAGSGFFMMTALTSAGEKARAAYADASSVAEESLSSIRTVVAFGAENKSLQRYVACLNKTKSKIGQLAQGMGMAFMMGVMFLTYALGFWYGGKLIADDIEAGCNAELGECFSGGTAVTVFISVVFAAFVIGQAGPNITTFMKGVGAAADLCELIDRKSKIDTDSTTGIRDEKLMGEVVFSKVKFSFPSRPDKPVFSELDLTIPAGKTVALVGSSGCGKSTTIQLVERFYDVDGGSITIDGCDVRDYNVNWLRSQMAIVSQEPRMFNEKISENIRFGRLDATQQEIEEAAQSANAHLFISDFPKKYDTMVGESGSQLSGGQKQRIAIARAVVRNPKILILDEATSALDNESEQIVQKTLDQLILQKARTTIVIAHRLTTIRNADLIVVLDNTSGLGALVAEQGTHDELMGIENGLYANLVESQSLSIEERERRETIDKLALELNVRKSSGLDRSSLLQRSMSSLSAKYRPSKLQLSEVVPEMPTKTKCGCFKVKQKPPEKKPPVSWFRVAKNLRKDWWKLVIGIIGALANGAVFPLFAVVFARFIGVYFLPNPQDIRDESSFWALVFVALAVGVFIAMSTQMVFFELAGKRLIVQLREELFDAMLHQEISFFDDPENSTGSLSQILSGDVVLVKGWVSDNTGILISNLAAMVYAMIIAFTASAQLAAVVLAGFFIMAPASFLEMKSMQGSGSTTAAAAETPGYVLNETISNMGTVTAFCLQKERHRTYREVLDKGYAVGKKNAVLFGFFFGFSQFAQFGGQALAYWYGARLLEQGKIDDVQTMLTATFALIFAAMGFGQAAVFGTDSKKAAEAGRNVYYILDRVADIDARSPDGSKPAHIKGNLDIRDVNFSYPQRLDVPVYKNLSFDVKAGETVALVGASGCGKSTVVQLLERFYDVLSSPNGREGGISVDDVDVRDYNVACLRSKMGLVSQEPTLFDTTIADNIKYGRDDASMDEVVAAARLANAHDFIVAFPDGYDTIVGKGGGKLSGGQKQRISIARAMIRDPKILLLDEATSALDAESEKVVQSALDDLLSQTDKKRTTLIIAHRLSTIRNADKIVVLSNADKEGSAVVEVGNHVSLSQTTDGVYANLVKIALAAGDK